MPASGIYLQTAPLEEYRFVDLTHVTKVTTRRGSRALQLPVVRNGGRSHGAATAEAVDGRNRRPVRLLSAKKIIQGDSIS